MGNISNHDEPAEVQRHPDEESQADNAEGISLVLENVSQEAVDSIMADFENRGEESSLTQLFRTILTALRPKDLAKTRLVITGDFVSSVNSREDRTGNEYTMARGGGTVAAKTMPPSEDGTVDILVPIYWVLSTENADTTQERDRYIQHFATHEAVHASLFHDGGEPFDVHRRRDYERALLQFVSMAGHQVEEHLAEYVANLTVLTPASMTADQLNTAFEAWDRVLEERLPAVSQLDPDYFQKVMMITLTALHDLWKVLSYYAAELREGDVFSPVPEEVAELAYWQDEVAPWWDEYTALLAQIPMSIPVDVEATDEVVDKLAQLLQHWAKGIGVDHHDTSEGPWFQMTRTL